MSINGIEVTDVIVFPIRKKVEKSKMQAFARVIINDQFIINGIRIFEGNNGPFIRFPQEYNKDANKGYDICFPTTAELRTYISDQVLSQYSISLSAHA
jgi:DNA-binding cell septation regulator SpoVG